jgi:hypothetical protein
MAFIDLPFNEPQARQLDPPSELLPESPRRLWHRKTLASKLRTGKTQGTTQCGSSKGKKYPRMTVRSLGVKYER